MGCDYKGLTSEECWKVVSEDADYTLQCPNCLSLNCGRDIDGDGLEGAWCVDCGYETDWYEAYKRKEVTKYG